MLRLAFDAPVTADRLVVTPCSASPSARYDVEVNGSLAGTVEPNGAAAELQLGAGGAGWRVADVELRLARSQPGTCVGEVSIVSHGAPLPLRPPRVVLAGVRASSVLSPALAHHPNLLFDHRLGFGWAVGRGGDGVGESVELTFKEPFGLLGAELWNGDQASPARFSASSSVRTLSVGVDNAPQINVPVDDVEGPQRLRLPRMAVGRTVKLAVLETRPGGSRRDLVLSELRLIDLLGKRGAFFLQFFLAQSGDLFCLGESLLLLADLLPFRVHVERVELRQPQHSGVERGECEQHVARAGHPAQRH